MFKILINLFFCLSLLDGLLYSDWTQDLGSIQKSDTLKKSYLLGMLHDKSYGIYKVSNLKSKKSVIKFYEENDYKLFWFDNDSMIEAYFDDMIDAIKSSSKEALNPQKYHLNDILFIDKKIKNGLLFDDRDYNLAKTKIDILLTDAFLTLAKDLHEGEIDFDKFQEILKQKAQLEEISYRWDRDIKSFDYINLLKSSKENGDINSLLYSLVPTNQIYKSLLEAYNKYKDIESIGGFKKVSSGKNLKLGSISKRVLQLKIRLNQSGDLDFVDDNKRFNLDLKEALKKFQKRVGLWASGVLNSTTLRELNRPVEYRLKKIKLNLERSRWESYNFDGRYILVNIPEFLMRFKDGNELLYQAKVIVGREKNPTPIFHSFMRYVVLNPTWSVPNSIVTKELLKKIQDDPYYLEDRHYKLYKGWSKNSKEVDAFDVDWFQYDKNSTIPYNIVKDPGKKNPLGVIKFMFPNRHAVYMHDTPDKRLFNRAKRAFSHGCIRLYQPKKLLEFISDRYIDQPYSKLKEELETGKKQSINLKEKIPVYIRYYTVLVDQFGVVNFFYDVYGYDKIEKKLLNQIKR